MELVHNETHTTNLQKLVLELVDVKVLYLTRKLGEVKGIINIASQFSIILCDSISPAENQAQMNSLITDVRNQMVRVLKDVEGCADQCVKTTQSVYDWIAQKGKDLPTPKPTWWCEAVNEAMYAGVQFHFAFISVKHLLDGKDRNNDTLIEIIDQANEAVKKATRFLTTTVTKTHAAGW
jgi:hypothetical protein